MRFPYDSVEQNRVWWSENDWSQSGEEWSSAWGGTPHLWFGTILPRILPFVPTASILEIAPGFGRCTRYLQALCKDLIAVDLSPKCVEACRERFREMPHVKVFENDGKSLPMVADASVDFIFSWDSLVHAQPDAMEPYVREFARVLKASGYGFLHHSNFGNFRDDITGQMLVSVGYKHGRADQMCARLFEKYCSQNGFQCLTQELIGWGQSEMIDCLSVFCRAQGAVEPALRLENPDFMVEAALARQVASIYGIENRNSRASSAMCRRLSAASDTLHALRHPGEGRLKTRGVHSVHHLLGKLARPVLGLARRGFGRLTG